MANSLSFGGGTVALPIDLLWVDEFSWRRVDQVKTYTLTGALIVEEHARQSGRAITLEGGAESAWITRGVLLALLAWADVPGRTYSLVLRGEAARAVTFDFEAGAIETTPLTINNDSVDAADLYAVKLRFIWI